MLASWCLPVVEMTLSKVDNTVVWELNELLAADRRAKAFCEALAAGEISDASPGFEASKWQDLSNDLVEPAEESTDSSEADLATDDSGDKGVEDPVAEEQAAEDIESLLEARYQEGLADGIRQTNLESQQREALSQQVLEAIQRNISELPKIWPVVTDLSLDIAKTVCLGAFRIDHALFREYLHRALKDSDLPQNIPIEIKVSEAMAGWISADALSDMLPEHQLTVTVDSEMSDGDLSITYNHIAIERLLEGEFSQLREQLVAQFPDRFIES